MTENLKVFDLPSGYLMFLYRFFESSFNYTAIAYLLLENWYGALFLRVSTGYVKRLRPRGKSICRSFSGRLALKFARGIEDCMAEDKKIRIRYERTNLVFSYSGNYQLMNTIIGIKDVFVEKQYKDASIKGKQILDIGASIGDSAIFWALHGAKSIIALEPYPFTYAAAAKNVHANGFNKQIRMLNEACRARSGCIRISRNFQNTTRNALKHFDSGKRVKITTLKALVHRYGLREAVLKIDCEGYEYEIIERASRDTLRKFSSIMLEYHHGYRTIERKLVDSSFRVRHTAPFYMERVDDKKKVLCGMIYAERKPAD